MSNIQQKAVYSIHEYRLVVPIAQEMVNTIKMLRKTLHAKSGVVLPFQLQPSLTLLRFHAFEQMEAKVMEVIQRSVLETKPFLVELENFAAYPSHTIYINVRTRSPFNELCKSLKKWKRHFNIPQHEPHFINEPHLILAQMLQQKQFSSMWRICENSEFTGKFIADHLMLYKRGAANKRYEVFRRMDFMQLPMNLKQSTLFS
ncbi:MAG TPA: 2'-5' RNA ligase family protein [Flavisolibacter sp.]|nr:2'-5' RNA ligase family protein [Flavisolibacter sp.]